MRFSLQELNQRQLALAAAEQAERFKYVMRTTKVVQLPIQTIYTAIDAMKQYTSLMRARSVPVQFQSIHRDYLTLPLKMDPVLEIDGPISLGKCVLIPVVFSIKQRLTQYM